MGVRGRTGESIAICMACMCSAHDARADIGRCGADGGADERRMELTAAAARHRSRTSQTLAFDRTARSTATDDEHSMGTVADEWALHSASSHSTRRPIRSDPIRSIRAARLVRWQAVRCLIAEPSPGCLATCRVCYCDQQNFEYEEVKAMIDTSIEPILGNQVYAPKKVGDWTSAIVEAVLKMLQAANKPFKYVVTCIIMQKNGAGLHTASTCFWDTKSDGQSADQRAMARDRTGMRSDACAFAGVVCARGQHQ